MLNLRSEKNSRLYQEYLEATPLSALCPLCDKPAIKEFTHWRIIENSFPYDLITETHDMIVPRRHVSEDDVSEAEMQELQEIKKEYIETLYDYILEATIRNKSIPKHLHLHLLAGVS